jgi:methyltransferase (TIGR00027 family)
LLRICPATALLRLGRAARLADKSHRGLARAREKTFYEGINITMRKNRIETKTSRTAKFTCMSRAASYVEKRECFKGADNIAYMLVPGFIRLILKFPGIGKLYSEHFAPKGIYEYVIARTKHIDAEFMNALENGFEQIVIFGAGFDTRAQRFNHLNKSTLIFELDVPITQKEKLKAFTKKKIMIPEKLKFVPINFNKDSLGETLTKAGFEKNRKALFLLEGVTMYLTDTAIDSTFNFIRDVARKGSLVVFDYIYAGVLREENRYYGERDIFNTVSKAGEAWTFALEEGAIEAFLLRYGFTLKNHSNAQDLEARFFKNQEGKIVGKVNGTHSIVTGIRG